MQKEQKHRFFSLFIYSLLLFLAYIIQTTPLLFKTSESGVYPNLILALVIVISMFETDYTAAIFGLAAGLLVDTVSVNGSGIHALAYMITGLICSLLIKNVFQNNFASFVVISVPMLILHQFFEIITKGTLSLGIFILFSKIYIYVALYTFVFAFFFYLFFYFGLKKNERFKKPIGILPKRNQKKKINVKKD